jgi:hypothetical protein
MKTTIFLGLFIILIGYIESIKVQYIVVRDRGIQDNRLSNYTIYDALEKNQLYRIRTISTDIDTMILVNFPAKNMIGNLEGEWTESVFNVSFSYYSTKSHKWVDGVMKKIPKVFYNKFSIEWDSKSIVMRDSFLSNMMKFYDKQEKVLLASCKDYSSFFGKFKYKLTINSDYLPHPIYFFALAIADHRYQIRLINSEDSD